MNRRLDDGEEGKTLVDWLNALPEVQSVLSKQFGGRPVREQNLSEWKQGGFAEWQRHQQAHERVRWLTERAQDLDDAADEMEISNRLASVLAAELAASAETLLEETTDPKERWQRLRELLEELRHLRYADHNSLRVRIEEERWDRDQARQYEEGLRRTDEDQRRRLLRLCMVPFHKARLMRIFGDGEAGREWADLVSRILSGQSLPDDLTGKAASPSATPTPIQPDQTKSNLIQPDQSGAGCHADKGDSVPL